MKRKQRIIAVVLLCSALIVMGVIQCFADYVYKEFETIPNDLGDKCEYTGYKQITTIEKYYMKVTIINSYIYNNTLVNNWLIIKNNNNQDTNNNLYITYVNSTSYSYIGTTYISTLYSISTMIQVGIPRYTLTTIYIPLYVSNVQMLNIDQTFENAGIKIEIYESKLDTESIQNEYYALGYNNGYQEGYNKGYEEGYPEGFNEAQNIKQELNIVQHIEQLIAQFTGNEYAKYITPIALVLTILMIYFLFIRFILSLMKAKGVIKTCDILMIVACIIVLIAMYMPMINLEITQHQIIEQVETTSNEVYTIKNDITYYTYKDEQGNTIHGGPAGTWIEYAEETTE